MLYSHGVFVYGDFDVIDGVPFSTFKAIQLKGQPFSQAQGIRITSDNLVAVIYGAVGRSKHLGGLERQLKLIWVIS